MRKLFSIALLGAAIASSGCVVPTLHPLFTDEDLVSDPRLLGAWNDSDDAIWVFDKPTRGAYRLAIADTREVAEFDAHLLELGPHRFLDVYPRTGYLENSSHEEFLLPVHTFYKVYFSGKTLRLIPMSSSWLEESLAEGTVQVAHVELPDRGPLLTASTSELQKFVLSFADDPAAFPVDGDHAALIELEPATF